jgi:hypothetical protein
MADYQGKLRGAQIDALPEEIGKKQDKLHVTLLNNSNVRIDFGNTSQDFMPATPSGDPMHYAYEAVGAVWNDSTGFWELLDLTDITNAEMRSTYNVGFLKYPLWYALGGESHAKVRINLARLSAANTPGEDIRNFAHKNTTIEVVNLTNRNKLQDIKSYESMVSTGNMTSAFYGCSRLKYIYGRIIPTGIVTDAFKGCSALERVMIESLKQSLSLSDSPLISKETVLNAIVKAAPTSQIVITLSGKVYGSMIRDPEIIAALAAQPLITLASA